jgi:hypothetical protein
MEILEIMLARPTDLDSFCRHRVGSLEPISQAHPTAFSSEFAFYD